MSKLIKNILVPTDFSDSATHALKAAVKIAQKISGQIFLYHRIHLPPNWEILTQEEKEAHPQALQKEKEMKKKFDWLLTLNVTSGIRINAVYSSGDLFEKAEQLVDRYDIDLVVMGSEGAEGVREWLYGSNAQKISNRVEVPVFIIKHPIEDLSFKQVVFASEFGEDAKRPFLQLIDMMRSFGSTINLLYVSSIKDFVMDDKMLEKMKEFERLCWQLPCNIHGKTGHTVELGVKFFMKNTGADLLTVVHHQKGPFEKLFKGSVSEKLINHLECPILSLPAEKKEVEIKE